MPLTSATRFRHTRPADFAADYWYSALKTPSGWDVIGCDDLGHSIVEASELARSDAFAMIDDLSKAVN